MLLWMIAFFVGIVRAQPPSGPGYAQGWSVLSGPWRFAVGDDPSFSSPDTKDTAWPSVELGFPGAPGVSYAQNVVWYRTRLNLSRGSASALLVVPHADETRIFFNGQEVSDPNHLGAGGTQRSTRGIFLRLPPDTSVLIAIRLNHPAHKRFSRATSPALGLSPQGVLVGTPAALIAFRTADDAVRFYDTLPETLLCCTEFAVGAVLLFLFLQDRSRRDYLWFGIFLWLDGFCSQMSVFYRVYPLVSSAAATWINALGLIGRYIPLISFLAAFTRVRVSRLVRAYQVLLLLTLALSALTRSMPSIFPSGLTRIAYLSLQLPFVVGSIAFLIWQARRNREALLLLPSFLLANGIEVLGLAVLGDARHHFVHRFGFDYDDMSMFFFLVSIAPVMIYRHRRDSRERARIAAELEAARAVQSALVPAALPDVPGYAIATAFLPAQEVGGDFYQVLPRPGNTTLVVVGDVSGKGLKAAMTGVLAIGALRTLAADNPPPAEILTRLNRQIVDANQGGFITCLCLLLHPDGTLTFANAGHLSPYRNAAEVAANYDLPLGIAAGLEYSQTTLQLAIGDQLTLITDGVLEARNHTTGELFGFDRTAGISIHSAESIAQAAQAFGQDDDITVLTLTRLSAHNKPAAQVPAPALSPSIA